MFLIKPSKGAYTRSNKPGKNVPKPYRKHLQNMYFTQSHAKITCNVVCPYMEAPFYFIFLKTKLKAEPENQQTTAVKAQH